MRPAVALALLVAVCSALAAAQQTGPMQRFRKNKAALAAAAAAADVPVLRILDATAVGMAVSDPAFCTTYASEMTGAYFCLQGDGTKTGQTLTNVGSVTTTTPIMCPNGPACSTVSVQHMNGTSQSYKTAAQAGPAGDFSVCAFVRANDVAGDPDRQIVTKDQAADRAFILTLRSGQLVQFKVFSAASSTATDTAAAAIALRGWHLLCGSYHYVTDGTSVQTVLVDGVVASSVSNAVGPTNAGGAGFMAIGQREYAGNMQWFDGEIGAAFYTEKTLTTATMLAMYKSLAPQLKTTALAATTFTRAAYDWCTAPDGTMVRLQNDRPCITTPSGSSTGMIKSELARTNHLIYSETLDNPFWVPYGDTAPHLPVVTANDATTLAPDGTATAERIAFPDTTAPSAASIVYQAVTFAAASETASVYLRTASGTATVWLNGYDNTSALTVMDQVCPVTTTWSRCVGHVALATAAGVGNVNIGVTHTGYAAQTVYVTKFQQEAASTVSTYIGPTLSTSVTRAAEAVGYTVPTLNTAAYCMSGTAFTDTADFTSRVWSVFTIGTSTGTTDSSHLYGAADGTVTFDIPHSGAGQKKNTGGTAVGTGVHRIAGCSIGGTLTKYIDGVLVTGSTTSGVGSGTPTAHPATGTLGLSGGINANGFVGNICLSNGTSCSL